jgi:uncharacterized protein YcaQ
METISVRAARRLALAKAGLLKASWTGMPTRAKGGGLRARKAAHRIIDRFGYLQLDTVAIAGARSHALVLLSRLEGFEPGCAESLLQPDQPLFEYWGHEACWLPIELYPHFEFRRREYSTHPWWGDVISENPKTVANLRRRICDEGPIRSIDMEGRGSKGWWDLKLAKRVAAALWSAGELAIRERRNFQRSFDFTERVIPAAFLEQKVNKDQAFDTLLLRALKGHGWATTGTLAQTWRLTNCGPDIKASLQRLSEDGRVIPCQLDEGHKPSSGWITPADAELADRLVGIRPRRDKGILLSPFDPVLWDRPRVRKLFGFEQILEIFKPAPQRVFGYYCLPVLAGDRLVARVDLKANTRKGELTVLSIHMEDQKALGEIARSTAAVSSALKRYSRSLGLRLCGAELASVNSAA